MADIDQTDDLENGAIATPANSFRGGKVYNLAKKLFVLPIVLLLACSDDNSASATADPQTPTSSESTGISSSSENLDQTFESSDSQGVSPASSTSDEFMIVPATPPDSVREEIEAAMRIEWLNNHTTEDIGFILCEIKLYRIGDSAIAPSFVVIEKPNDWAKEMKQQQASMVRAKLPRITDMLKWGIVKVGDIVICNYTDEEVALLANGHVQTSEGEMSLQQWLRNATGWPSVQTYVFAIHKETAKTLQQLRKEYMDQHPEVN